MLETLVQSPAPRKGVGAGQKTKEKDKYLSKNSIQGLEASLVVAHLLSMHEALELIPSSTKNKIKSLNSLAISFLIPGFWTYLSLKVLCTSDLYLFIDPLNSKHMLIYVKYGSLKEEVTNPCKHGSPGLCYLISVEC